MFEVTVCVVNSEELTHLRHLTQSIEGINKFESLSNV